MEKIENNEKQKFIIPEEELSFATSRSSGAGGQNVNKLETKATVRWDFQNSKSLNNEQKQLILEKLKNRINKSGILSISAQEERSQAQNKQKAVEILNELINQALTINPNRKKTKTPEWSKEERLIEKKKRKKRLENRNILPDDESIN